MQEFSKHRNAINPEWQNSVVNLSPNLNRNQLGNSKRAIPFDVHQHKFEGKSDDQLLPMDVDQNLPKESGNKERQKTPNQPGANIPKTTNPRAKSDAIGSEIVQEILEKGITVQVGELIEIAPGVRRNLLDAVKGQRGAACQTVDQKENNEKGQKIVLGSNLQKPSVSLYGAGKYETRDDLLTVSARMGRARLTGVFDSGSQANIISEKYAKKSGLPIQVRDLERVRITGIDGGIAKCVGIIPNAKIYITESELETTGQLLVIRDATFDLLLGRPWGTSNGGGITEKAEGTHLEFYSDGHFYTQNISPSNAYKEQIQEPKIVRRRQWPADSEDEEEIAVGAVSWARKAPQSNST